MRRAVEPMISCALRSAHQDRDASKSLTVRQALMTLRVELARAALLCGRQTTREDGWICATVAAMRWLVQLRRRATRKSGCRASKMAIAFHVQADHSDCALRESSVVERGDRLCSVARARGQAPIASRSRESDLPRHAGMLASTPWLVFVRIHVRHHPQELDHDDRGCGIRCAVVRRQFDRCAIGLATTINDREESDMKIKTKVRGGGPDVLSGGGGGGRGCG
jgi:hypothetical protein